MLSFEKALEIYSSISEWICCICAVLILIFAFIFIISMIIYIILTCIEYKFPDFVTKIGYKAHVIVLEIKNRILKRYLKEVKKIMEELLPITNEYDNYYYKSRCGICTKMCQYKLVDKTLKKLERIKE